MPSRIPTKSSNGVPNGFVIPCWSSITLPDLQPEQVYVTVVSPYQSKGPHLHLVRRGLFVCLCGDVVIVTRNPSTGVYTAYPSISSNGKHQLVSVPAGTPAKIYNLEQHPAYVLNMPSPAWSPAAPDDNEVENWDDPAHHLLIAAQEGGVEVSLGRLRGTVSEEQEMNL